MLSFSSAVFNLGADCGLGFQEPARYTTLQAKIKNKNSAHVFATRVSYRGEEHCEEVDGRLCDVAAFDGHHDGGQEEQVADGEQESCCQLATVGQSCGVIGAAPTTPACAEISARCDTVRIRHFRLNTFYIICVYVSPALQTQALYR